MPTTCLDVVPQQRLDVFASQGMTLLDGPGSPAGGAYDRYPVEDELGDIECIWGTPGYVSNIGIDIGPMRDAKRQAVSEYLSTLYLEASTVGDVTRYTGAGTANLPNGMTFPARVDIVRPKSWITVTIDPPGAEQLTLITEIADEVEARTNASAP